MKKRIAILGSTGSIGRQALDVVRALGWQVVGLSAHSSIDVLEQQIAEFHPAFAAVADEDAAARLAARLGDVPGLQLLAGKDAARNLAAECAAELVLNAIVGIAGLSSTLTALASSTDVALANKESLVAAGALVMQEKAATGANLLPVDSEHSAIFQCLQDEYSAKVLTKIILTASGGPFYGYSPQQLAGVTKQQALRHPNWEMGAKITIDSATMMNKGLELIEAMWLFGLPPQQIEIVVQRESIIHSMVQFCDNSVIAQLGAPDMRLPIQYALTWPQRLPGPAPALDFASLTHLSFGTPDEETFRCLAACRTAAQMGGLAPCAANGANEQAVALFLEDRISFTDIGRLVEGCLLADSFAGGYTLDDVYACDAWARRHVRENI
ncbi:1-deoxy-D-xylulose-5-phosphate reductoisomerase [Ruminococcaceae bacterium OttesenSCG-928-O06]|nr:1-deoxy-D-xylulose-5-phosphate reductoisomerase [Ruminococcaceae bacterium OttesenSCG-928-O06]